MCDLSSPRNVSSWWYPELLEHTTRVSCLTPKNEWLCIILKQLDIFNAYFADFIPVIIEVSIYCVSHVESRHEGGGLRTNFTMKSVNKQHHNITFILAKLNNDIFMFKSWNLKINNPWDSLIKSNNFNTRILSKYQN